jgi:hypothetical protein
MFSTKAEIITRIGESFADRDRKAYPNATTMPSKAHYEEKAEDCLDIVLQALVGSRKDKSPCLPPKERSGIYWKGWVHGTIALTISTIIFVTIKRYILS